ncbi:MAG: glycosyl hydrolase [Acidobacteriaceae bacterium]
MRRATQAFVLTILSVLVITTSSKAQTPSTPSGDLHQQFVDPPRDFSPMPFWFWNGKMESPKIQAEIRDMASQHVYGSFLHARDGLETPYLSDEWWTAIGAGLEQAKRSGFEFNFVDEYDWPSGEVRNVWMSGNHQSEILAQRPDFRMKTLAYSTQTVQGPQSLNIAVEPDTKSVVAVRWISKGHVDGSSLTLLNSKIVNGHVQWSVPDGTWVVLQFHLEPAMGFDGGFVDLMNPEAMKLFFQLTYEQYYRHFKPYFGSTIHYSFSDHEGDYGYRIAWTPRLFEAFQQRNGYDLRTVLPLLIYDGGDRTTKVRTDYLSTVTQLYAASFWSGITDSAAKLGVHRTGHAWEESLQWAAALEGSLFAVERGLNPVGVDSLGDFGRQPLNFKLAQSVADYEGRRFMCENQGVQGTDSYLDLQAIRKGTNAIGAWGVDLFVPHAFDYDTKRANYPPDWLHQPYWPYFHYYADYTRRISYMNADSHHVTNVLLYYPITTMWAHTSPVFSGSTSYGSIGEPAAWKNSTILINDYYTRIILDLADHQWDYNIADDQYLDNAKIEGNELVIGAQRFRTIILPPITTLSRKTLQKLEEFHQAGGTILAIRLLPNSSPEAGGNDTVIESGISALFGTNAADGNPIDGTSADLRSGGAYYIADSVDKLISALDATTPKDVQVMTGPSEHLYFEHRQKLQTDYYWVVNDTDRSRINQVHFAVKGIPEKWSALTGKRETLFYVNDGSGTDVRLNLAPWDAYYIAFRPLSDSGQNATLLGTNAEQIDSAIQQGKNIAVHVTSPMSSSAVYVKMRADNTDFDGAIKGTPLKPVVLTGDWEFRPQPDRISVPYAQVQDGSDAVGEGSGWDKQPFDDTDWPSLWLSQEQTTIRNWQMIGPFPNLDNNGFAKPYPPETEFDPAKKYVGLNGQTVGWKDYYGNEPHLALQNWDIWMKVEGGRFSSSGYIVQFNPELLTDADQWIVSYAHTYLYSPIDQQAQFIVAADNWARIWLNHKQVFEQLRTPFWYEVNDNWADRVPVELHAGWNEVLMKVGKARGVASGFYGFSFRVADKEGNSLTDVIASLSPRDVQKSTVESTMMRWYRILIPPGCVAVVPPRLHDAYQIVVNGHAVNHDGESPVDIHPFLNTGKNMLVIIARENDLLDSPVQFVSGETPFALQPWTHTGLENFSGSAIYTKTFTVPANFRDKQIMLNLGKVSSVADVYVNDKHAGTLVWQPYQLDISKLIQPGENRLKIIVTDTEANRRAVGTSRKILAAIDICGMEGPVQLIPYINQVVTLRPTGK